MLEFTSKIDEKPARMWVLKKEIQRTESHLRMLKKLLTDRQSDLGLERVRRGHKCRGDILVAREELSNV